jgi:hypothetical protein
MWGYVVACNLGLRQHVGKLRDKLNCLEAHMGPGGKFSMVFWENTDAPCA